MQVHVQFTRVSPLLCSYPGTTKVDYCFLYMYVENRFNPQQSIYPMSLKPFKWNPSKYKQCKNADYHIVSGMLAFNSLSQWILMLQWFCYPCIPNT